MKFVPNPNFDKELAKAVAPAMAEFARKRTDQYDALIAEHQGGDVELVKAQLESIYEADGGHIGDPELSQHADAIVAGLRIVLRGGD